MTDAPRPQGAHDAAPDVPSLATLRALRSIVRANEQGDYGQGEEKSIETERQETDDWLRACVAFVNSHLDRLDPITPAPAAPPEPHDGHAVTP